LLLISAVVGLIWKIDKVAAILKLPGGKEELPDEKPEVKAGEERT